MSVSFEQIFYLMLLLVLSGFFSGAEVALVSLPKAKVKKMVKDRRKGCSYVMRLKEDTNRMLSTILIGNNLVNVAASAFMTSIVLTMFGNSGPAFALGIATGVMTFLILVFGEIVPKSIASENNTSISLMVAPVIWYMSIVLAPIITILDAFLNHLIKFTGIKSKEKSITEEEIRSIVTDAEKEGSIKAIEKNLIQNVFEFDEMRVSEIITPRNDIQMVRSDCSASDALKRMIKTTFSRLPVYKDSKENITGVLLIKDVVKEIQRKKGNLSVAKISKKPFFVPETKKVSSLLRSFQGRNEQMALVVDEHGTVTGLVTLEDVLEEIVGEIMDESDRADPAIKKIGRNSWLVQGKTDIEEVNTKLKMGLKEGNYDTFSGFILHYTGKIPAKSRVIEYNNFRMTIKEKDRQRISMVKVEKK